MSSTVESGSPNSGSSTPTSEGSAADTQISATFLTASGMQASGGAWGDDQQVGGMGMDMSTLLDLTSRMVSPLPLHGLGSCVWTCGRLHAIITHGWSDWYVVSCCQKTT